MNAISTARPRPPLARAVAIAATLAAVGVATAAGMRNPRSNFMSANAPADSVEAPVLRLSLGDSVRTITQNSEIAVPPRVDPLRDPPFIVSGKPLTVEYTRPGTFVRFPTGLFTALSVEYGHAVGLELSPHRRALTLDEALALASDLGRLFERGGWHRAHTYVELDAVPAAVEVARRTIAGRAIGYEAQLARWGGIAGDTLTLGIRRQSSAEAVRNENTLLGKRRPEVDHYLLNVEVENSTVSDHFYHQTVAARDRLDPAAH